MVKKVMNALHPKAAPIINAPSLPAVESAPVINAPPLPAVKPDPKNPDQSKYYLELTASLAKDPEQEEYFYGPLPLKKSERELSLIIENILAPDKSQSIVFDYNASGELTVCWENSELYNITEILREDPCFEHIEISLATYDRYKQYLDIYWKQAEMHYSFLEKDYFSEGEQAEGIDPDLLKLSEKEAIFLYTMELYKYFNSFLRDYALKNEKKSKISEFIEDNPILLLSTIAIASSGLKKLNLQDEEKNSEVYRVESSFLPQQEIERRKEHFSRNASFVEFGFFSGSNFKEKSSFSVNNAKSHTLVVQNKEAKPISAYSCFPSEKELLCMPGTRFSVLSYGKHNDENYFVLTPVSRTLPNPKPEPIPPQAPGF
ncbi:MAG: hypothetical protein HKM04_03835 [Legionellales bacterium]|nr:hypothetical protein [Legionellales bacterium]